MKSSFAHLSINVTDTEFYRRLLEYLGFKIIVNYSDGFGASDGTVSAWVFKARPKYAMHPFHRKAIGLNHIALRVKSKKAVDAFYTDYLLANNVPVLYGGPAFHPEYVSGYYAVYFEDLDRIKLEVAYIPGLHS